MLDLNAKYPLKLEQKVVNVIKGYQNSPPILKLFYDTGTKELGQTRNSEDYSIYLIIMFGVHELRQLHLSYIHFLAMQKFEKVIDRDCAQDLCYFIHMIKILSIVYEKLALRNELLEFNVGNLNLYKVEALRLIKRKIQ